MKVNRFAVAATAVLISLFVGGAVEGQTGVGLTLSLAPTPVQVTKTNGSGDAASSRYSGMTIGGALAVRLRKLRLDLRYLEGGLSSDADLPDQDIVEGELMLGFAPFSWLVVKTGPHIRSFVTSQGTQRWVFWEGRAALGAKLGSPNLVTYLEAWHVFASDVDAVEPFGSGNGMEAGISYALSKLPFMARLAYRIDNSSLGEGSSSNTVEQLVFAIGWLLRR